MLHASPRSGISLAGSLGAIPNTNERGHQLLLQTRTNHTNSFIQEMLSRSAQVQSSYESLRVFRCRSRLFRRFSNTVNKKISVRAGWYTTPPQGVLHVEITRTKMLAFPIAQATGAQQVGSCVLRASSVQSGACTGGTRSPTRTHTACGSRIPTRAPGP